MEDGEIVALFFQRSEQALAELDKKHGRLCRRLAYRILNDQRDAEECVNDAYLGVWNAIPPAKPEPFVPFLCKIVRNLSLKELDRRGAAKRNSSYDVAMEELEGCLAAPDTVEETLDAKELAREIEGFLDTLRREDRVIFLQRYWFAAPYGEIGRSLGLSEKGISVRLVRIRKKLKRYLQEKEILP